MAVFVLDRQKHPLMPCTEKRVRLLLERGRAVVVRLAPFTIRLKDRVGGTRQPLRLTLDPGSRVTGLALVRESATRDPEPGAVERLSHRYCRLLQRADGYGYTIQTKPVTEDARRAA